MSTYTDDGSIIAPSRSSFLTVLCVLSFLGSGYGIFKAVTSIVNADKIAALTHENIKTRENENAKQKLSHSNKKGSKFALRIMESVGNLDAKKIRDTGIGNAIANALTLAGALLMWRLKRSGFYLYVLGTIASVLVPFVVLGSKDIIANIGAVFMAFVGVVFIAMYAFNLRDMK